MFLLPIISFSRIGQDFGINVEYLNKAPPKYRECFHKCDTPFCLTDMNTKTAYIEFPKSGRSVDVERWLETD